MFKVVAILAILGLSYVASAADEPDWAALGRAKSTALKCASPASFSALFELASSDQFNGADASEALSEVNEEAFLRCPVEFMEGFQQQSPQLQTRIATHFFGVMHEPWELGTVLGRLQHHPKLGGLVKKHFGAFIRAKAPFEK